MRLAFSHYLTRGPTMRIAFVGSTILCKAVRTPLFAKRPDPAGQHELGKTRRGKPVYASGAETEGYNPDDHQDAARLHHRAHLYHEARAGDHEAIAGKDDEWRRAEVHHAEHGRHGALAEHHHAMARDHLLAGKHGGEVKLHLGGTKPRAAALAPHPAAEVAAAKRRLAQRSHHDHPGGLEERDKGAYARIERGEGDDE